MVQNASPAQLEVIRELIKIYDQPVSEDAVSKRRTCTSLYCAFTTLAPSMFSDTERV